MMRKQYIRPAHEQMLATIDSFVATSIQITNNAQNGVSGDVKESNGWDDTWGE